MNKYTDSEILEKLRSPDELVVNQAFNELYDSAFKGISNMVRKNSGTELDAEDIFQDSLIIFYNQIRKQQLNLTCAINTYLYSICRNLWLKKWRKTKRELPLNEQANEISIDASVLSILESSEQSQAVSKLMSQLSPDCQKVLLFFYYDRLSMKEIAQKMDLSGPQVAKNKKSNCMKSLKKLVKDHPELEDFLRF